MQYAHVEDSRLNCLVFYPEASGLIWVPLKAEECFALEWNLGKLGIRGEEVSEMQSSFRGAEMQGHPELLDQDKRPSNGITPKIPLKCGDSPEYP